MKPSIEVSVILPMYNEEKEWLELCFESLLDQDFDSYEIIAILDNPDNQLIKKIMSNYENNEKIKCFINIENIGIAKTLNRGIDLAQGKYIAIMNADDISRKNRLRKQWIFLEEHTEISLVAGDCKLIDDLGATIKKTEGILINSQEIRRALKFMNPTIHPTWMGKREVFNKLKYKNIIGVEDMDFLCRLILSGYEVKNIGDVLLDYRIRATSITNTNELTQQFLTYKLSKYFSKALSSNDFESYDKNIEKLMENMDQIVSKVKNNKLELEFYDYKEIVNIFRRKKVIRSLLKFPRIIELMFISEYSEFFRFKLKRYYYKHSV